MKPAVLRFAFLALFFLLVLHTSQAQEHSSDAHISGTLLDSSGAGVGRVQITARLDGDAKAPAFKTVSSDDGAYALSLPASRYHVSFVRESFGPCYCIGFGRG